MIILKNLLENKLRFIITGGSGLLAVNWAMVASKYCEILLVLHERMINMSGVKHTVSDLSDIDDLIRIIKYFRPDYVVHAAGLTSVEKCENYPNLAYELNVLLASNVAKACFLEGVKLIHVSTDHLFDGLSELADEDTQTNPQNTYARTKLLAEEEVLKYSTKPLIIRTNFFAWGTSYRKSFSDQIIYSLRAGKKITLFDDVFYTPILVERLVQLVERLVEKNCHGIFNVVGDERLTKFEFGKKIARKFLLDESLISCGYIRERRDLVFRPKDLSLSNFKLTQNLCELIGDCDDFLGRLHDQESEGIAESLLRL
jgi:dTDP-4-dehydrorhamnose reductase